jgi:hypothetical protein
MATRKSANKIVDFVLGLYEPRSVVDVGASGGLFIKEFLDRGIEDVMGIDGPWIPDELVCIPKNKFVRRDFNSPLGLDRKFDMAICLEVLEHLNKDPAISILNEIAGISDVILFSAAIPGQGGTHHVNEQWPSFWAEKLEMLGFKVIDIRPYLWNDNNILPWYRQNIILYAREPFYEQIKTRLERYTLKEPINLIHPEMLYFGLFSNKGGFFTHFIERVNVFISRATRWYLFRRNREMYFPKDK